LEIRRDDLTAEPVLALLREHLEEMVRITPPGSVHALDLEGLRAPAVTFWSVWNGAELLGCGALKELDPGCGEIKSMRTAPSHRGRGVASKLLGFILEEARRRGYATVCLETGAFPAFAPARSLYERHGFRYRGPFSDYVEDSNSVFMGLDL
jgi:putative acetyltransferase